MEFPETIKDRDALNDSDGIPLIGDDRDELSRFGSGVAGLILPLGLLLTGLMKLAELHPIQNIS